YFRQPFRSTVLRLRQPSSSPPCLRLPRRDCCILPDRRDVSRPAGLLRRVVGFFVLEGSDQQPRDWLQIWFGRQAAAVSKNAPCSLLRLAKRHVIGIESTTKQNQEVRFWDFLVGEL